MNSDRAHNLRPKSRRALIVEDDLILALSTEMLLTDAGHTVVGTATTEDDAVDMALRENPDVMLVDLRLAKGGSGRRVAERVRTQVSSAIIFVSGNLDAATQQELAPLAPAAMIGKPYFDSQILSAIEAAA